MDPIEKWYLYNINLLEQIYGEIKYDLNSYRWIRIEVFKLPIIYEEQYTKLLIKTPGLILIEIPNLWSFYMKKDLKRKDKKTNEHIYNDGWYNDYKNKGYAKLCFHFKEFSPSLNFIDGENIGDMVEAIYNFLGKE